VFFFNDIKRLGWKVVLRKEARSRREVFGIEDVFITTTLQTNGLNALITLPPPPNNVSLIGAIELSNQNQFLTCAKF
jgi:hypothetical protein